MEVGWWLGAVAFFTGTDHIKARAQLAWKLWQKLHDPKDRESDEEESTLDVWDIKYGRRGHEQSRPIARPQIPNFDIVEAEGSKNRVPAFFAVQVHELPRNSDIEWQGLGYRCEGVRLTRTETEFGRTVEATTTENQRYSCIEIDSEADLQTQIQRVSEVYAAQAQSGAFHCVIYSSQPLPQDCSQGQVIPCKSVWGADGRRLAAGVIIQKQT
jgi:diphthine-ammonia ligase